MLGPIAEFIQPDQASDVFRRGCELHRDLALGVALQAWLSVNPPAPPALALVVLAKRPLGLGGGERAGRPAVGRGARLRGREGLVAHRAGPRKTLGVREAPPRLRNILS